MYLYLLLFHKVAKSSLPSLLYLVLRLFLLYNRKCHTSTSCFKKFSSEIEYQLNIKKIPHSKDKASLNQCGRYHRYHKNFDLIDLMINDLLSLNSPGFFFFFFPVILLPLFVFLDSETTYLHYFSPRVPNL